MFVDLALELFIVVGLHDADCLKNVLGLLAFGLLLPHAYEALEASLEQHHEEDSPACLAELAQKGASCPARAAPRSVDRR